MIATPRAARRRRRANSRSTSALGQSRGRFVENEQPRLLRQGPDDQHKLLVDEIERSHRRFGVDVEPKISEKRARPRADAGARRSTRCRVGSSCRKTVLADRQVGRDVQLLRQKRDARPLGFVDRGGQERSAAEAHLAGVATDRMHARQDLNERRLARPVLTEERDDLARSEGEIDVVDGDDGRKGLGQAARDEGAGGFGVLSKRALFMVLQPTGSRILQDDLQTGFLSGTFL